MRSSSTDELRRLVIAATADFVTTDAAVAVDDGNVEAVGLLLPTPPSILMISSCETSGNSPCSMLVVDSIAPLDNIFCSSFGFKTIFDILNSANKYHLQP